MMSVKSSLGNVVTKCGCYKSHIMLSSLFSSYQFPGTLQLNDARSYSSNMFAVLPVERYFCFEILSTKLEII